MSEFIFKNIGFWAGEFKLSGSMNMLGLDYGADQEDATSLADNTHINLAGLKTVAFSHEGMFEQNPDERFFTSIGLNGLPMLMAEGAGADGNGAKACNSQIAEYSPGASIGEILRFGVAGSVSSEGLIDGDIMANKTVTSTENGVARQLGAVSAAQKLYMSAHVITVSGTSPTLDITVQSDDNGSMTTPVTRGTFSQFTAVGSSWLTPVSGAITDDYWRVVLTVGGSDTPTFAVVCFIGIQ